MCMQPPFFSIGEAHLGQLCTRAERRKSSFSASCCFCRFLKAWQELPAWAVPCSAQ